MLNLFQHLSLQILKQVRDDTYFFHSLGFNCYTADGEPAFDIQRYRAAYS